VVNCWGAVVNAEVEGAILDRYLLDTGIGHACTVNDAGMVCWGLNSKGQLGVGNQDDSESALSVRNIQSVVDLATGLHHTCAIIDDEIIKCWGENLYGQLGDATITDSTMPVLVK